MARNPKNSAPKKQEKITKLTPEQEARMKEYTDMGLAVGLCTDRVNFDEAREALIGMYRNVDLTPPTDIRFARGPREAYDIFKQIFPDRQYSQFIDNCMFGNHESYWLYFYKYFNDVVGIELEKLPALVKYAQCAGWCYLDADVAIIMDRPSVIKMDEMNRTHCENGPAIRFEDGFEVYIWHGVRVPKAWIADKSLTPGEALKQQNMELRRAACEILGWNNIIEQLNSTVIDEDDDPEIGTLLEVDIPEVGRERFLRVRCGTGRTFALAVPPTVKTALEANAWTFDIDPKELMNLEVRT